MAKWAVGKKMWHRQKPWKGHTYEMEALGFWLVSRRQAGLHKQSCVVKPNTVLKQGVWGGGAGAGPRIVKEL